MKRPLVVVLSFSLFSAAIVACSVTADSGSASSADTQTDCRKVTSTPSSSQQTDDSGNVVSTTFTVNASGCIAANGSDVSGSDLVSKIVTVVDDDRKLASISGPNGRLFASYSAHPSSGTPSSSSGQTRSIDVTLNVNHQPTTTLQVTLKRDSQGNLSFRLTNTAPIGVMWFNAIDAGGLDVRLTAKPGHGMVTIAGTTKIVVNPGYESSVDNIGDLPALVIGWLRDQIAPTADAGDDGSRGDNGASGDPSFTGT